MEFVCDIDSVFRHRPSVTEKKKDYAETIVENVAFVATMVASNENMSKHLNRLNQETRSSVY